MAGCSAGARTTRLALTAGARTRSSSDGREHDRRHDADARRRERALALVSRTSRAPTWTPRTRSWKHGGKTFVPPSDIPGIGRFCVVAVIVRRARMFAIAKFLPPLEA